jgi:hypothetical protein
MSQFQITSQNALLNASELAASKRQQGHSKTPGCSPLKMFQGWNPHKFEFYKLKAGSLLKELN